MRAVSGQDRRWCSSATTGAASRRGRSPRFDMFARSKCRRARKAGSHRPRSAEADRADGGTIEATSAGSGGSPRGAAAAQRRRGGSERPGTRQPRPVTPRRLIAEDIPDAARCCGDARPDGMRSAWRRRVRRWRSAREYHRDIALFDIGIQGWRYQAAREIGARSART